MVLSKTFKLCQNTETSVDICPPIMHPYHTRCDVDTISQRTCMDPTPHVLGFTCGWSRCDCPDDLVLHDQLCIPPAACPSMYSRPKRRRKNKGKKVRLNTATDVRDLHRGLQPVEEVADVPENVEPYGVKECPEHMHRVNSECRPTPSQRTCEEPVAQSMGVICGWSRYTGHCPMLKFRYGKCYGDNTRQILKEIRSKGLFNKPLEYRPGDHYELASMPKRDRPLEDVYDGLRHRQPAFMTGYTGYVPGMSFRYGKSYSRVADDCMSDFANHQREWRRKEDFNKSYFRSRSAPKMETVHTRDEIRRELNKFREINKYKENTISPEFPPIAGYTGHIPRIKGTEASLSQRYHCAAKRGLELIRMEKDKRNELQNASANVRDILREKEKKYSYWNWG